MSAQTLTREQAACSEFLRSSDFMREIADDKHGRALLDFTDSLILAVTAFGTAELHARHAERCEVLKLPAQRARLASQQSARHHDKGLTLIAHCRKSLKEFRRELDDFPTDTVPAREFETLHKDIREALVELEVKASDVDKIDKTIRTCLDLVSANGAATLPDYLDKHLDELESLRKRKDRGAVENIPVWKVAAIALAVGVWVWALFRCRWWGSCSKKEGLSYFILFWLAVLIARFC